MTRFRAASISSNSWKLDSWGSAADDRLRQKATHHVGCFELLPTCPNLKKFSPVMVYWVLAFSADETRISVSANCICILRWKTCLACRLRPFRADETWRYLRSYCHSCFWFADPDGLMSIPKTSMVESIQPHTMRSLNANSRTASKKHLQKLTLRVIKTCS